MTTDIFSINPRWTQNHTVYNLGAVISYSRATSEMSPELPSVVMRRSPLIQFTHTHTHTAIPLQPESLGDVGSLITQRKCTRLTQLQYISSRIAPCTPSHDLCSLDAGSLILPRLHKTSYRGRVH